MVVEEISREVLYNQRLPEGPELPLSWLVNTPPVEYMFIYSITAL